MAQKSTAKLDEDQAQAPLKRFLDVGGGDAKERALNNHPFYEHYKGWKQEVLDISPAYNPDILHDARKLKELPGGQYDAALSSHNLEHFYTHEVPQVVQGIAHMLKPDGFLEIWVPDVRGVMQHVVENDLDLDAVLYSAPKIDITVRDVLYGQWKMVAESGPFMAHKTGFSITLLKRVLHANGFKHFLKLHRGNNFEIGRAAFKQEPTQEQLEFFDVEEY